MEDFHRGLNERPDGEEMQHKLISELNLGQGMAKFGAVKPITTREQLSYHGPNGNPHWAREEGWEDWGNSVLYSGIAKHTKFDSVKKVLATRTDTQTHDIQDALKQNTN